MDAEREGFAYNSSGFSLLFGGIFLPFSQKKGKKKEIPRYVMIWYGMVA